MPVQPEKRYVLDTNVFRDVQRGDITQSEAEEVGGNLSQGRGVGFVSPISLIEVGSHIGQDGDDKFNTYQVAFNAIQFLCQSVIDDPDAFVKLNVFRKSIDEEEKWFPESTGKNYIDTICATTGVSDLRDKVDLEILNTRRSRFEQKYVNSVTSFAKSFIPDYDDQRLRKAIPMMEEGNDRDEIVKKIKSDDFANAMVKHMARESGLNQGEVESLDLHRCREALSGFVEFYRSVLLLVLHSGYNFAKNKNDRHDSMFLYYLSMDDVILVTQEKKMLQKIPADCQQKSRIVGFADLL